MTTIAWDGTTVRADSLCTKIAGLRMNVAKLRVVMMGGRPHVYAMAGDYANCIVLADWWAAHPNSPLVTWPEGLTDDGPLVEMTPGSLVKS